MSKPRTDSSTVTHNEDGSTTYSETYTTFPPTKGEKVTTGLIATLGVAVAFAPLAWEIFVDKRETRKKKQDAKKADALWNEVK